MLRKQIWWTTWSFFLRVEFFSDKCIPWQSNCAP
jgi:hypothetical protein